MSNYVIIADSSCDLNSELRKRFKIADYIPGIVVFPDGHAEKADLDWKNISPKAYFGSMKDKKHLYTTSLPNPEDIKDCFAKHLSQGLDILAITLSSGLSGTYDAFCMAARELSEKYPDRKIKVVDSLKYSSAIGLLCVYASLMRDDGKTLDEAAEWLEANKLRIHQMGVLDDLFFCSRMGRVSNVAAIGGTLIGIKPLADFNRKGLSHQLSKTLGLKNSYRVILEYIRRTITNPEQHIIFVANSVRESEAADLKQLITQTFNPKEVIMNTVGQSCGASIGPGLFAVFYYGEEISEDMSYEKALLDEIIAQK